MKRGFMPIAGMEDRFGVEKNKIPLPKRSTSGSAGYDFFAPYDFSIEPGDTKVIDTFVKAYMQPGEVLYIFSRSSFGIKKKLIIPNSVGVIDADYFNNPKNDGHIMICFTNIGEEKQYIFKCEKMAQGIFMNYLIADGDDASGDRVGGIGSTGR